MADKKHHPFIHHQSRRLHVVLLLMAAFFCLAQQTAHIGLSLTCMCNSTAVALLSNVKIETAVDDLKGNFSLFDNESCTKLQGRTVKDYGGSFVWSVQMQGYIVSATFLGGFVFAYPAGFAVDKYSARHALSISILVISLASLSMPLLIGYFGAVAAIVVRFVMGLAEAMLIPALNSMVTRWIPMHEKSTAAALFTAGNQLSGIVGTPVVAELCASPFGWPAIFYVGGLLGFVWLAVWHATVRNSPRNTRWIDEHELRYLDNHLPTRAVGLPKKMTPWSLMLTSSLFWSLMYCSVVGNMMIALIFVYIPVYFKDVLMLDVQANGFYSSIPHLSNLVGKIAWGIWIDRMKRDGKISLTTACKLSQTLSMLGIAVSCFFLRYLDCSTPIWALILLSGVSASFGLSISGFYTSLLSVAPSHIGVLTSLSNVIGFVGRSFTPQLISYFKTIGTAEEWGNVLLVYTVMSVISAGVFILFGSGEVQSWDDSKRHPPAKLALIAGNGVDLGGADSEVQKKLTTDVVDEED